MKIIPISCRIILVAWITLTFINCQPAARWWQGLTQFAGENSTKQMKLKFNTQDFAPFTYLKGSKVDGPVVEIIERACRDASIDCEFELLDWKTAQQQVRQGKADGLFVIGWNAKRTKWLHYSDPFIETEYGFFIPKKSNRKYQKLKDFEGHKVAVYGPSNTATTLERLNSQFITRIKIDLVPDTDTVFRKLAAGGSVQAAYSNRDTGRAHLARMGIKSISYAKSHKKLFYYVGISKNVPMEVVNRFNQALRKLHREGVTQSILGNYGLSSAASHTCTAVMRNTSASLNNSAIDSSRMRIRDTLYSHQEFKNLSCDYPRRFVTKGAGDIFDNATGIVWQNPKYIEVRTWDQAVLHINRLNKVVYGNHRNWRLPTVEELDSLLRYGVYGKNDLISKITKRNALPYWSVDKVEASTNVWTVDFLNNVIAPVHPGEELPLIAVRSTQ